MSDIACLCTQVNTVAGLSFQFTNLIKWGAIALPLPLFHCPWYITDVAILVCSYEYCFKLWAHAITFTDLIEELIMHPHDLYIYNN